MNSALILKFGGTSVGSAEIMAEVTEIVADLVKTQEVVGVVFSAMGGTTDKLINTCKLAEKKDLKYKTSLKEIEERHYNATKALFSGETASGEHRAKKARLNRASSETATLVLSNLQNTFKELEELLHGVFILGEASLRTIDLVMSFGERLSTYIMSEAIKLSISGTEYLDARQLVRTDSVFSNATVDFEVTNANIRNYFEVHKGHLQVITGFIGSTESGHTTTLGRGGSDFTVSVFGAALGVQEIQIWTDVDGVLTADPRKVENPQIIQYMSFEEAMEMSFFGAKVIYPPTMLPALEKGIPIRIKNTFNPKAEGTVICNNPQTRQSISGISCIQNVSLLNLQGCGMVGVAGISHRLFGCMAREGISVILISQASSEHSICWAVVPESAQKAKETVEKEFELEIFKHQIDRVSIEDHLSIIAVVGDKMKETIGICGILFSALGKARVNVTAIAQGSSERNISVVIKNSEANRAMKVIHDAFFNSHRTVISVYIVGTGLIGAALIDQIHRQLETLAQNENIELRVLGIANSKKMIIGQRPIPLADWRNHITKDGSPTEVAQFIHTMQASNQPNPVFVDATAGDTVYEFYPEILKSGISVVSPNKKANSGPYARYLNLKTLAKSNKCKFLYETNVGAGLPVLGSLKNLLLSGDKLLKLEAIISGTLSYIFNTFSADKSFSSVVVDAKHKGFTEPDPREDLNGLDVARKLLILARESGLPLEMEHIHVENLVPENCRHLKTADEFMKLLPSMDGPMEAKRQAAEKHGKVLRYIATIENNKAHVSLQEVDKNHAAYHLSGSDNIFVFTTERYLKNPLVVKGPGAGAEVTAAGVFADLLSVVR